MGIEQARRAARKALERTYEGRATVYEYQSVRDPDTFLTDFKEVTVLEDQPCKLSFKALDTTTTTGNGSYDPGREAVSVPGCEHKAGIENHRHPKRRNH